MSLDKENRSPYNDLPFMDLDFLQKIILFKGFTKDELELVSGLLQARQIKSGTIIFTAQMPAEALYIIQSGNVRVSITTREGSEVGLVLLGPGDFFGELALLQEQTRMVTARAETTTDLILLTRKDFQALIDLDPRLGARILMVIAKLLALRVKAQESKLKDLLLE